MTVIDLNIRMLTEPCKTCNGGTLKKVTCQQCKGKGIVLTLFGVATLNYLSELKDLPGNYSEPTDADREAISYLRNTEKTTKPTEET